MNDLFRSNTVDMSAPIIYDAVSPFLLGIVRVLYRNNGVGSYTGRDGQ